MTTTTQEKPRAAPKGKAEKILNRRNAATVAATVKLGIFTLVSVSVTSLLAIIMGNFGFGATHEYKAVFTNASMLEKGDDVRVAGVSVGEVKKVEHYHRNLALVSFKVDADVPLTTDSTAAIRYLNLVGDRYLALEESANSPEGIDDPSSPLESTDPTATNASTAADPTPAPALKDGATIPVSHTAPALDLTTLFNGFQPLFQALNPTQVNQLSMNLIQVLQGEGGTVEELLAKTASLTNTLADRDQLIGQVVDNLSQTLTTVDQHHVQLNTLVLQLKRWMTGLAADRDTIGTSISNIGDLTAVVADLVRQGRPLLKSDVAKLRQLASLLNKPKNTAQITELLDRLPESMTDQTRTGTYGSWYNYYVCGFSGRIDLPPITNVPGIKQLTDLLDNLNFHSSAPRCNGAADPSDPNSSTSGGSQ